MSGLSAMHHEFNVVYLIAITTAPLAIREKRIRPITINTKMQREVTSRGAAHGARTGKLNDGAHQQVGIN